MGEGHRQEYGSDAGSASQQVWNEPIGSDSSTSKRFVVLSDDEFDKGDAGADLAVEEEGYVIARTVETTR